MANDLTDDNAPGDPATHPGVTMAVAADRVVILPTRPPRRAWAVALSLAGAFTAGAAVAAVAVWLLR